MNWTLYTRILEPGWYWARSPIGERKSKGRYHTIYGEPYVKYFSHDVPNYELIWPEKLAAPVSLEVCRNWNDCYLETNGKLKFAGEKQ
jgi:hypothetical protein